MYSDLHGLLYVFSAYASEEEHQDVKDLRDIIRAEIEWCFIPETRDPDDPEKWFLSRELYDYAGKLRLENDKPDARVV